MVPLRLLHNIEITNYIKYEPRFNGVFLRNNLSRIKIGVYVINLDDEKSKGTHLVSLFINRNTTVYFDSSTEYMPQEVLNKIKDKSVTHNILIIQDNESIM